MNSGKRLKSQRGFTFLIVLALVGVLGVGSVAFAELWTHASQREMEAELLWVGEQFRQAIGLYYERSPGAVKRFPEQLQDLLQDARYPSVQRYLRRIYADPVTGKQEWGLVQSPDGRIMGVHSLSRSRPVKSAGFPPHRMAFEAAATYSDWRFVHVPVASRSTR